MIFAYIRATNGKEFDYQQQLLKSFGHTAWESEIQGGYLGRKTFDTIVNNLSPNEDCLVIANLDVLPFPTMKLIEFVSWLNEMKIELKILEGDIDLQTIVSLRKHSLKLRSNNAKESLKGLQTGRRKGSLSKEDLIQARAAYQMYESSFKKKECTISEILAECGYSATDKPKMYRHIKIIEAEINKKKDKNK